MRLKINNFKLGEVYNAKSAKKIHLIDEIKTEPMIQIKSEPISQDDKDSAENIELLANLNLESSTSNFSIKQEPNESRDVNVAAESDLKFHLENQTNSKKFLFYWFDAYEDSYNSNGTVFLFGNF